MSNKHNQQETPNALGEALSASETFIEKHQKSLLITLCVVVAIILGVLLTRNYYVVPKENEAQELLIPCVAYFERDSFNLALNGDGVNLGFADIVNDYSITKSSDLAAIYAGSCCYHLGQYDEALDYLSKFDKKSVNMTPAVIGLMGDCYVELNDLNAAVKQFERAAVEKNELTAPFYLKKAGIVYEELKDYRKATDLYLQIKENYPTSQQAMDIDKYIERAKLLKK